LKIKQKSKFGPVLTKKRRFYTKTAKNNPSKFENPKKRGEILKNFN